MQPWTYHTPGPTVGRRVTLQQKAAQIAARIAIVGKPDTATIARARNNGSRRTESKRELLAVLAEGAGR